MIEIKPNISIPKINELYAEFDKQSQSSKKIDLMLPKKIDSSDMGVLFSFLQFVATWMRSDNSGNLRLPVNGIVEAIEYLSNEFVYPSIALSWEKEILDMNSDNLRPLLKDPTKQYFYQMDFFQLKERLSVPIFCFDHDKRKSGHSKNLYDINQKLLPEDAVTNNLYPAYKKIGGFNKNVFIQSMKDSIENFDAIIHELFANTDEHAKTDENGFNLYPNIRAIYLKFHKKKIESNISIYKDFPGLVEYFESEFKLNDQNELYMVEISILDSGPGLVKRYKGISKLELSINDEIEVIKECLYRHNTSAQGLKAEIKGMGLDRVLRVIDGKGFVRIKSGRADVFRNMKKWRYRHHEKASDIILFDLQKNSCDNFMINPESQGTLISIFFPLDYKSI